MPRPDIQLILVFYLFFYGSLQYFYLLLKHLSILQLWLKSLYYSESYFPHLQDFLCFGVKDIDGVLTLWIPQLHLQRRWQFYPSNTHIFLHLFIFTPSSRGIMLLRSHLSPISPSPPHDLTTSINNSILVIDFILAYRVVQSESLTAFSVEGRFRVFYWWVNIVHSLDIIIIQKKWRLEQGK